MNKESLYILKFQPILKEKIWGGSKLHTVLAKNNIGDSIGESWEISDVEGNHSIVSNGILAGKTLHDLLLSYKEEIIGVKNFKHFGSKFPLLIKFIDANKDLSVQLHPGDEIAKRKHNSFGKTEMWYVVASEPNSNIIIGFNQPVDIETYQKHVENKTIKEILHYEPVVSGDTFFVSSGLIHAIGGGVLLAEIQQTSDITYRVYDWDRVDKDGNYRELHQQDAIEAINFDKDIEYKVDYKLEKNNTTDLVTCPHFITNIVQVDKQCVLSHSLLDSFVIYMCVEGSAQIESDKNVIDVRSGETFLVPACIKEIKIVSKHVKLLQTYI